MPARCCCSLRAPPQTGATCCPSRRARSWRESRCSRWSSDMGRWAARHGEEGRRKWSCVARAIAPQTYQRQHVCLPANRLPAAAPPKTSLQGRFSPAWEMIPATRHLFFLLANPLHSVTCFELPVYRPSPAERADPKLYAANVRKLMVSAGLRGALPIDRTEISTVLLPAAAMVTPAAAAPTTLPDGLCRAAGHARHLPLQDGDDEAAQDGQRCTVLRPRRARCSPAPACQAWGVLHPFPPALGRVWAPRLQPAPSPHPGCRPVQACSRLAGCSGSRAVAGRWPPAQPSVVAQARPTVVHAISLELQQLTYSSTDSCDVHSHAAQTPGER